MGAQACKERVRHIYRCLGHRLRQFERGPLRLGEERIRAKVGEGGDLLVRDTRVDATGSVLLSGGNGDGQYAQIGNGGYQQAGNFGGNITVNADGSATLNAGSGNSNYALIGNGGQSVDGDVGGTISLTTLGGAVALNSAVTDDEAES
mgnify:CR=1 FL=1